MLMVDLRILKLDPKELLNGQINEIVQTNIKSLLNLQFLITYDQKQLFFC